MGRKPKIQTETPHKAAPLRYAGSMTTLVLIGVRE